MDLPYLSLRGDCRERLPEIPDRQFHACVTSPPYWGLRSYLPADHPDKHKEIGQEKTPQEYVDTLVGVFREVRRTLRDDGTLWLNLGDCYARNGGVGRPGPNAQVGNTRNEAQSRMLRVPDGIKPKDLVGIPWRVALALQQPYERVVIRDRADRAWLAALIDGEGCITTVVAQSSTAVNESYAISLGVRMTDRECVDRVVEITGMSKTQDELQTPAMAEAGQRPVYSWKISSENAATVLAEIYPYLRIKRRQAVAAWNLQRLKDGITTKRGVVIPAANMELRRELHRVIRALNQRQPADVPGWCREPEYTIEPGWYLRSDVVWEKPNPMPESVTDRPTRAHEYLFLFSKSEDYYYDAHAIKEPCVSGPSDRKKMVEGKDRLNEHQKHFADDRLHAANRASKIGRKRSVGDGALRNKRSVWRVATVPYKGAHFATFPPKLIEPCILAGTSEKCCPFCGAPYVRVLGHAVPVEGRGSGNIARKLDTPDERSRTGTHMGSSVPWNPSVRPTIGWQCPCEHADRLEAHASPQPASVLDPFGGAHTVALVAKSLGRTSCIIELNTDYAALGEARATA